MNVQVTEYYVTGCAECMAIVENITRSFIRDITGSKLMLLASTKQHCHESVPQGKITAGAASAMPSPAPADLADTSPALFCPAEIAAMGDLTGAGLPNGFDCTDRAAS